MTRPSASQGVRLVLLALLSGAGCSDPTDVGPCSGTVDLSVIEGQYPEFQWGPCGVNSLVVFDAAGQVLWNVHAPETTNSVEPPILYAQVPENAVEDDRPQTLNRGSGYVVRVFRTDREGERVLFLEAGEANFRY